MEAGNASAASLGVKLMANGQLNGLVERLRKMAGWQDVSQLGDGQLLDRFIANQDSLAFEALMQRHGPMVLGVCRRLLHHAQDAEDAFQATFLVLVKKAATVRPPDMVANWLYGVAYRASLKARSLKYKRRDKESQMSPIEQTCSPEPWNDLANVLDEELERLPDKYRAAVVLCELEGKSRKDAADQLHIPEGTLSSRLATARKMLGQKLSRRGVTLTAACLTTALPANLAGAAVPATLMSTTLKAAQICAAGQVAAVGIVSAQAAAVASGVLQGMFIAKVKTVFAAVLVLGLLAGGGSGYLAYRGSGAVEPVLAGKVGTEKKQDSGPATPDSPSDSKTALEKPVPPPPPIETKEPDPPEETSLQWLKKEDDKILVIRAGQLKRVEAEEKRIAEALMKEQEALKLGDAQAAARINKLQIEKALLANQRAQVERGIVVGGNKTIAPPLPTDEQRLGVQLVAPSAALAKNLGLPKNQGAVVERMEPDGPADKVGLQLHDILLKIDGKTVPSQRKELKKFLAEVKTDVALDALVLRDGKQQVIPTFVLPSLASRLRQPGDISVPTGALGTKKEEKR